VVQMYETMMTRHSTMLVGPTGGGKTVVINALIKAQTHMSLPTKCTVLNPKVSGPALFPPFSLSLPLPFILTNGFVFHGNSHIVLALGIPTKLSILMRTILITLFISV